MLPFMKSDHVIRIASQASGFNVLNVTAKCNNFAIDNSR